MTFSTLFTTALLVALAVLPASAQKINSQIDALLAKKYADDGPGGAILVSQKGKIIYQKGFGKASLELNVNNTPNSVFEIGSITKQFTAVAILMLEEQGKLSTNDPITRFLPDFPMQGKVITIHQLLTHTAGIANYTDQQEWAQEWRTDMTVDQVLALFKDLPLDFTPGEKWNYSNSGYILLGAIIEKVSGMSYEEFIESRIFKPAGMAHSSYGRHAELVPNRSAGYMELNETTYVNAEYVSLTQPYAAGSLMSTVGDMFLWQNAMNSNKFISQKSKEKAWKNYTLTNGQPTNYGYGWMPNEIFGSPTVEHSGGIFGYSSNGIYAPNEDVYVIILTNCMCNNPTELSLEIAALAIGKPLANPKTIALTDEQLQEYVAIYEFEDGTFRTITSSENQLYSQRSGGMKLEIYPYKTDEFYFKDSFTRLQFTRNNMNQIGTVVTTSRNLNQSAKRTDKQIVENVEIALTAEELKRFAGDFELAPNFIITIREREGKLFAQASGQQEFEIFPKSALVFFTKIVDAEIEFIAAPDGNIESMILHQNGQNMPGKKL